MVLMEASFIEEKSPLPASHLYKLTAEFLVSLHRLTITSDDPKYKQAGSIQKSLWSAINALVLACFDESAQSYSQERVSNFLVFFKTPVSDLRWRPRCQTCW